MENTLLAVIARETDFSSLFEGKCENIIWLLLSKSGKKEKKEKREKVKS